MAKVITFSRHYPAYHIRKKDHTFFVERLLNSFPIKGNLPELNEHIDGKLYFAFVNSLSDDNLPPKHHTVRRGKRYKKGDWFSPRVWSGTPYHSKQIIIAPLQQITEVYDFDITEDGKYLINGKEVNFKKLITIAQNDGFEFLDDFELWFNLKKRQSFSGQVICWNSNIKY